MKRYFENTGRVRRRFVTTFEPPAMLRRPVASDEFNIFITIQLIYACMKHVTEVPVDVPGQRVLNRENKKDCRFGGTGRALRAF